MGSLNLIRSLFACWFIIWMKITTYLPFGKNIFEEDWDLLIVLDACRTDALRSVADEYEFIDDVDSTISLGSSSREWMINTFHPQYSEEINNTTYMTGNGWVENTLMPPVDFSSFTILSDTFTNPSRTVDRFLERPVVMRDKFEKITLQPMVDVNGVDGLPAEDLTDLAIQEGREESPERLIAHYMQPHTPYLHRAAKGEEPLKMDQEPFKALQDGADHEEIWDSYLDNLCYVLDSISVLLNNYDADQVVITADHGELFGELGQYGHAEGILHPKLRAVPWVVTSANDSGTREPSKVTEESETEIQDRLEALGYL